MHEQLHKYQLDKQLHFELEVVDRLAAEDGEKFSAFVSKVKVPELGLRGPISVALREPAAHLRLATKLRRRVAPAKAPYERFRASFD